MAARTDLVRDEQTLAWLLQARRGTAYFARKLRELPDSALAEDSRLPGWSRAHLVAHVGYNARALARLVDWAETGEEHPMYSSPEARNEEIELGATLSPIALRNLFDHAAIHLNVQWRDLPDERWDFQVRTAQGRQVPVSETPWMRIREVWIHAMDLGNGGQFSDIPTPVLERLRQEIAGTWASREEEFHVPDGELADQVQWMSGRRGLLSDSAAVPPPRWL
ncbi:maleylpyruvate isomerase family mycothiol-dependent enzyme [Acaricomes phytoseiuli]|uniref:maleylpyruvate isomerase family mycothiol-dependent enzyme n=1 Tax=Acaricomes phytoseiuli TaxID=291968 RepID=UPI00037C61CA|nr:maleylpyruvate isomerase family mycothiol-dependent enzyme [Acaricomes phytoseiuli]MCW1250022.1 maleylpyruvate isomerase family mycothiol-dependent enzyme [Acaricomes phytoseiuli]